MSKAHWFGLVVTFVGSLSCFSTLSAQKIEATVLYRQNSDSDYRANVPGFSKSTPEGYVDCAGDTTNADCLAPAPPIQAKSRTPSSAPRFPSCCPTEKLPWSTA